MMKLNLLIPFQQSKKKIGFIKDTKQTLNTKWDVAFESTISKMKLIGCKSNLNRISMYSS